MRQLYQLAAVQESRHRLWQHGKAFRPAELAATVLSPRYHHKAPMYRDIKSLCQLTTYRFEPTEALLNYNSSHKARTCSAFSCDWLSSTCNFTSLMICLGCTVFISGLAEVRNWKCIGFSVVRAYSHLCILKSDTMRSHGTFLPRQAEQTHWTKLNHKTTSLLFLHIICMIELINKRTKSQLTRHVLPTCINSSAISPKFTNTDDICITILHITQVILIPHGIIRTATVNKQTLGLVIFTTSALDNELWDVWTAVISRQRLF